MNTQTEIINLEQEVASFVAAYQRGMEAWEEAGRIIVRIVDHDPHAVDDIMKQCPALTPTIIGVFERIGRGLLLPSLAMDSSEGARRLRELPLSLQKRYEQEPIPLIVNTSNGTDVLLVDAKNMTREQVKQVFAKGRIRTEGEQKAFLAQQASNNAKPCQQGKPAWTVKNGRVIFEAGTTLTAGELATILAQITK
jgi:hypothetical protein